MSRYHLTLLITPPSLAVLLESFLQCVCWEKVLALTPFYPSSSSDLSVDLINRANSQHSRKRVTLRLATLYSGLMQCQHPIWASIGVLGALLMSQFPAYATGIAVENGLNTWDLNEAPASLLWPGAALAIEAMRGNQQMEHLFLMLCNSAFSISLTLPLKRNKCIFLER